MGIVLIIILTLITFCFSGSWQLPLFVMIIFTIFAQIPYMAPRLNPNMYQPYELWISILIIFYILLPKKNSSLSL